MPAPSSDPLSLLNPKPLDIIDKSTLQKNAGVDRATLFIYWRELRKNETLQQQMGRMDALKTQVLHKKSSKQAETKEEEIKPLAKGKTEIRRIAPGIHEKEDRFLCIHNSSAGDPYQLLYACFKEAIAKGKPFIGGDFNVDLLDPKNLIILEKVLDDLNISLEISDETIEDLYATFKKRSGLWVNPQEGKREQFMILKDFAARIIRREKPKSDFEGQLPRISLNFLNLLKELRSEVEEAQKLPVKDPTAMTNVLSMLHPRIVGYHNSKVAADHPGVRFIDHENKIIYYFKNDPRYKKPNFPKHFNEEGCRLAERDIEAVKALYEDLSRVNFAAITKLLNKRDEAELRRDLAITRAEEELKQLEGREGREGRPVPQEIQDELKELLIEDHEASLKASGEFKIRSESETRKTIVSDTFIKGLAKEDIIAYLRAVLLSKEFKAVNRLLRVPFFDPNNEAPITKTWKRKSAN